MKLVRPRRPRAPIWSGNEADEAQRQRQAGEDDERDTDGLIRRLKISGWISEFSGTISCTRISVNSVAANASRLRAV
jgi:hypothetical protein